MIELNFPNPVATRADLFDRDGELALIEQTLHSPTRRPVVILGERVIGKTSLLNVACEWAARELGMVVLKLPSISSRDGLAKEILGGIAAEVGSSLYRAGLVDEEGSFRLPAVGEFIRAANELIARQPDLRFLVCLEELDSILLKCGSESVADAILDFLLHLIERTGLPLRFVFTTAQIHRGLLRSYASPFLNAARLIPLAPWRREESLALAEWLLRGRFTFDAGAHEALFAAGGGHPYLTKAVLHALLQEQRDAPLGFPIGEDFVRQAVAAAARMPEVDFTLRNIANIHFSEPEHHLLVALAVQEGGLSGAAIGGLGAGSLEAARALARRGYLRGGDGDSYTLRFGLLGHWFLSSSAFRPDRPASTVG